MRNILKSLFIATVTLLNVSFVAAKDPSSTLDIKEAAAGSTYYTLDAVPNIKNLDWVGYNSTGSGSGGCVTESHWKLSNSRTLTFKVKNCTKIEAKDAYFSKDATTELKYSVNGATEVAFATNGDQKKICASGSFETGNTGEITVVLSADNDIVLNNILFYSGEGSDTPGGGDDPTPGGGDDPTPGGGDDPTPGGGDDPQPSGDVYAHWRFSGSEIPAIGSSESGTNIKVEFLTSDDTKSFSTESAGYNADVPDDMKSQGAKGVKNGANKLYLKVTVTGGFKANDVVTICGYNPWKVSSTDAHEGDVAASVATGTAKGDYNVGSFTLSADADVIYMMRAEGTSTCICAIKVTRAGGDTPSNPIPVESVTLDVTSVVMDINDTKQLTATVAPNNATDKSVTWASSDAAVATVSEKGLVTAIGQGSATITATSNMDNTKTGTCSVTVNAPAAPIEVESISMKAATTIGIGSSETLVVTYYPENANTGKAITWTSSNEAVAKVDANGKVTGIAAGPATITATSENGKTATCEVTVKAIAVTGVSLDKTSATIKIGNSITLKATVSPDDAANKNLNWYSDNTEIATVANGIVSGIAEGFATITVTTEDGEYTASCSITVTAAATIQTNLTLHEPGLYEEVAAKGGYDAVLSVFDSREYEVYYAGRFEEKVNSTTVKGLTIQVNPPVDKMHGITKNEDESSYEAADGWFKGSGKDKGTGFAAKDEFTATIRCHTLKNNSIELHIKGYDQFSLYGADKKVEPNKPQNNKVFKVTINGVEQEMPITTEQTVRRFDISTGEQVILIESGDDCLFGGFSLRVAQIPMVKYVKGNDSTQVVLQTENLPRPITYYTKYNKLGETRVIWEDKEATGIELTVESSTEIGDTLVLTGVANCPVGVYPFHISSFDSNGKETKRLPSGKITVKSDISAIGDSVAEVYEGEAMEELTFSYHALDAETDITIDWKGNTPDGISGHGEDGTYYISGTPTQQGEYPFTISVKGGNSVNGIIKVLPPIVGDNLVLYLYTNGDKESILAKDGIAALLSTQFTLIPRKAQKSGLRPITDYQKYKWALISEDANANNAEVLALINQPALPILNMKGFSYADERLSWGDPNNGSLTENGQYITVQRDDHPIFQALGWKHGQKIKVLKKIDEKGLMPIDINKQGTFCLATSLARARDNYDGDGDPFTFLHEKPAGMSGNNNKYICMPIAMSSSKNLTQEGQNLLASVVNYLLNDEPSVTVPQLQITSFIIDGIPGNIDQAQKRITFEIDLKEHFDVDKYAIKPEITIADETYTRVSTKFEKDGYVDFSESWSYPVVYEVSDYINRQVYEVAIRFFTSEGIEDVYAAGDWVNIYDIFGRKVSTTNEDIYHMVLPRGVYVIVTETGQTFKIMR